eukprot:TRINITY_DN39232_c0_g1_i1.p1 TRINITY_DN39232_c0_g1~~TRINITY_DN39232_c0_g1_i1.p1  ORF type:complete len:120 (-),score=36.95 TRINITY_DN39232_c0_g1_i1:36-395(-)
MCIRDRRRAERTEEEQIALEKEESSAMFHSTDGEFRRRRKVAVDGSSMLQGSRTKKKKNQKKEVEMEQLLEDESENRIQHLLAFGDRRPSHPVSYTHLRAHETPEHLVCRLLLEKKKTI